MSNVGRELTIRVVINDDEKSNWIWESLANKAHQHGVEVHAVSNGDLFAQLDKAEESIEVLKEELASNGIDFDEDDLAEDDA